MTALHYASAIGHAADVDVLLAKEADKEAKDVVPVGRARGGGGSEKLS